MAIDDNTVYGLTGAQIKQLPGKIEAVKGLPKVLTTADYNYPSDNPYSVALWLLEPGIYQTGASSTVQIKPNSIIQIGSAGETYIIGKTASQASVLRITHDAATVYSVDLSSGANNRTSNLYTPVLDSLTSTSTTSALAAGQGKVLNDKVVAATSYTTSEVDTGGTWVDGSTIYKKTINFGALPNATTKSIDTGIAVTSYIVKIESFAFRSTNKTVVPLPFIDTTNLSRGINLTMTTSNSYYSAVITTNTDRSDFDECYITLYYTKSS